MMICWKIYFRMQLERKRRRQMKTVSTIHINFMLVVLLDLHVVLEDDENSMFIPRKSK